MPAGLTLRKRPLIILGLDHSVDNFKRRHELSSLAVDICIKPQERRAVMSANESSSLIRRTFGSPPFSQAIRRLDDQNIFDTMIDGCEHKTFSNSVVRVVIGFSEQAGSSFRKCDHGC